MYLGFHDPRKEQVCFYQIFTVFLIRLVKPLSYVVLIRGYPEKGKPLS